MWSLYRRKEIGETIGEGLFDYEGEKLEPLKFSNGKTQEDVVKEVLEKIKEGKKIIFIRGVCGSGKSAIALNIAKHFNKTSIVVPIKNLQDQYERDYTLKNFLKKDDGNILKISVIKGRNNFDCIFCNCNADENDLPCNIEIKEKNIKKIKEYIKLNLSSELKEINDLTEVRRVDIAGACPYWSPLLPSKINSKVFLNSKKRKYTSYLDKEYFLFQRRKGCKYYEQYNSYIDSDVIVFNSLKYLIEIAIGRKPKTDLDIIDECDEFLDSLTNERKISLTRFLTTLNYLYSDNKKDKETIKEMISLTKNVMENYSEEIELVDKTPFLELMEMILENPNLAEDDEDNYYNSVVEICRSFENIKNETYLSFEIREGENKTLFGKNIEEISIILVSINLSEKLKEIIENLNVIIFMSGTLHSEKVLKEIFGLKDFVMIEAETKQPGIIKKLRTGLEKNCKYENFINGKITRKEYLEALERCIEVAQPPVLIHVSSFMDLPSEKEKRDFNLKKLITREELVNLQKNSNQELLKFKNKEIDIFYTTKCSRGVDFPGDQCNSIILTKFPYPNIQDLFWKILKQKHPEKFREFYVDKSNRELIQKISRGIRFKGDSVYLLSPDVRVLDFKFD